MLPSHSSPTAILNLASSLYLTFLLETEMRHWDFMKPKYLAGLEGRDRVLWTMDWQIYFWVYENSRNWTYYKWDSFVGKQVGEVKKIGKFPAPSMGGFFPDALWSRQCFAGSNESHPWQSSPMIQIFLVWKTNSVCPDCTRPYACLCWCFLIVK